VKNRTLKSLYFALGNNFDHARSENTMSESKHRYPVSSLWPTVWLIIALIAIKASYFNLSKYWTGDPLGELLSWPYLQWLAAISQADVLFALCVGLLAASALLAARGRAKTQSLVYWTFILFGLLALLYAVVSRQVYAYYSAPLTYQLLTLAGEPRKLWSSVEAYVTYAAVCFLIGIPSAFVLLSWVSDRFYRRQSLTTRRSMQVFLTFAVICWLGLGQQLHGSRWFQVQDHYIVESPHTTLLQSYFLALANAHPALPSSNISSEDLRDFLPATQRPSGESILPSIIQDSGFRPRNVILIVLESVGTRYLQLYGSNLETTPRLERERSSELVVEKYYAPVAWTAYSLISLVLSKRPPFEPYKEFKFEARTKAGDGFAQVLRSAGYRTAFMSSGDPDWASPGFLEQNGFQDIVRGEDFSAAKQISSWGTKDRLLFDEMLSWIAKRGGEPFFLMAWTDQTHQPYELAPGQTFTDLMPGNKQGAKGDLNRYLSLIRDDDAEIGRLLDSLLQLGLAKDTLVVITGDHGEAFADPHSGSGHGFTVYDEEVRVPLIVWNPWLFRSGRRLSIIGSHTDLAPTILDLLGIPGQTHWEGRSLFDPSRPPRTYLFAAAWGQYLLGVRQENFKYIYDARQGQEELYDLSTDPDEQRNISVREPELAKRLRRRLAAWLRVERQEHADSR
jgi:phosphoglycerol transferase MdoB-like AlkP superfamily enzyme